MTVLLMFIHGIYKVFKDLFYSLVFLEVVHPVTLVVLNVKGGYFMGAMKQLCYLLVCSPNSDLLVCGILYNSSWKAVCFLPLLFNPDDSSIELFLLELKRSW